MKKFASLILAAVLLATMLCVFSIPASAAGQTIPVAPYEALCMKKFSFR